MVMAVSGRTSKVSSVIAALCIAIYIVAVAFGVVRVIVDIGERRVLAEREFHDLTDRASSSAVFLGFMTPAYQETIRDFLGTSEILLGIIISSSSGEFAFERHQGSGIVWAGSSPRFKTGIGFPRQPLFMPLRVEGQAHVSIHAIYNKVNNAYLLIVLRDTLLAVLIALSIAFITLIVEMTLKNRSHYQAAAPDGPVGGFAPESRKGRNVDIIRRPDFGTVSVKNTEPDSEPFPNFEEHDMPFSMPEEDEPGFPDIPEPDEQLDEQPFDADASSETISSDTKDNPQGLFTSRGNIGWESYTHDRLASELHRCASFEQDLVFLIMEFKYGEDLSDSLYRQFADEAVSFFTMRDLIFERGENGISVILPSTDLEHGMTKSEDFRKRLSGKLPDSFLERNELYMGLSSRSGRLIEADRLMLEAATALNKTQEEPVSPIVAFKSDPDKYRAFVKTRS